eukprot:m.490224 g.490224  ORF g.490224 m.490224 type:complete len:160 (+) comp21775_c0_seq2:38-517(+)
MCELLLFIDLAKQRVVGCYCPDRGTLCVYITSHTTVNLGSPTRVPQLLELRRPMCAIMNHCLRKLRGRSANQHFHSATSDFSVHKTFCRAVAEHLPAKNRLGANNLYLVQVNGIANSTHEVVDACKSRRLDRLLPLAGVVPSTTPKTSELLRSDGTWPQ